GPGITGKHGERIGLMAQAVTQVAEGPVLEAVHLVAPAEMHLSHEAGAVAVGREMPGPGDVLREDGPVIAPPGAAVRFLGGEHAHPRRRAGGSGATART